MTTEAKQALIEKVLGEDKSDIANKCRFTCEATFATKENKDKIWAILIDENTEYSI